MCRRVFGEEHPHTLASMNHLAETLGSRATWPGRAPSRSRSSRCVAACPAKTFETEVSLVTAEPSGSSSRVGCDRTSRHGDVEWYPNTVLIDGSPALRLTERPMMPTDAARRATTLLRYGSHSQWHVMPLLLLVLYVYANEIERRNWNVVFAGLALWGADWLNEIGISLPFTRPGTRPRGARRRGAPTCS